MSLVVKAIREASAARHSIVLVALSYVAGLSAVMLMWAFGGRALIGRVRRAATGPVVQRGLAGVLILTGVVMAFNLDVRFERAIASDLPSFDPT